MIEFNILIYNERIKTPRQRLPFIFNNHYCTSIFNINTLQKIQQNSPFKIYHNRRIQLKNFSAIRAWQKIKAILRLDSCLTIKTQESKRLTVVTQELLKIL